MAPSQPSTVTTAAEYSTADLYEAAYAIACRHSVLRVTSDGRRCIFHFAPEAETTARQYSTGGSVEARLFGHAISHLKTLIHRTR